MAIYKAPNYIQKSSEDYAAQSEKQKWYMRDIITYQNINKIPNHEGGKHFALLGYACDEGVRRAQGRVGTYKGPDALRRAFGALANHFSECNIEDFGDFCCVKGQLELVQHQMANGIKDLLYHNYFPICIGGGHDLALAHFDGVQKYLDKDKRLGIINFDAHFDLVKPIDNEGNATTPFYQIADLVGADNFYYLPIGIQKTLNSKDAYQTASALQVEAISYQDCQQLTVDDIKSKLLQFIGRTDHLIIMLDMDVFNSYWSPGVSAPNVAGLSPEFVLNLLQFILQSNKVISLEIAELNPDVDTESRSAQLAAYFLWQFFQQVS